MRTYSEHLALGNVSPNGDQKNHVVDYRAYGLIEGLRPVEAWLCRRDFWHLQELRRQYANVEGGIFPLLSHLARAKLQDATLLNQSESTGGIATLQSRVEYSIRGTAPQSRVLYYHGFSEGQGGIPINTLLGATLLGMKVGQVTSLIRADGSTERLELTAIHWQPGADPLKIG